MTLHEVLKGNGKRKAQIEQREVKVFAIKTYLIVGIPRRILYCYMLEIALNQHVVVLLSHSI